MSDDNLSQHQGACEPGQLLGCQHGLGCQLDRRVKVRVSLLTKKTSNTYLVLMSLKTF
jgi:hypothetical protein